MKLLSLFLKGRKNIGLESDELIFGKEVTELYGPNGSGKTPLIQSIIFCLGYPCKFRDEIYRSCQYARLKFEIDDKIYISEREFSNEFILNLYFDGVVNRFYNELDYSKFIFDLLNINSPSLITTQKKQTYPYLSSILPIYYLDQDSGFSRYYNAPANYIKDQFSEMLRLIFQLPEKNSFEKKKLSIDLDAEIKYLDESLVVQRKNIDLIKKEINDEQGNKEKLEIQINELNEELDNLKNSSSVKNDAILGMDKLIYDYKKSKNELQFRIGELKKRSESLDRIKNEINIEINTLNLNEEAKRVFISFEEICSSANCGLFSKSTESYAKNLLYLKDQIKDIDRSINTGKMNIDGIILEISQLDSLIKQAQKIKSDLVEDEGFSSIIETVSTITARVFELQQDKEKLIKLEKMESIYIEYSNKRDSALDRKESITKNFTNLPKLIKIKNQLRELYIKWLDIMNTTNVNRNISFKDDFSPILGNESIEQLKGSTKVRAILAYRASLIETIAMSDQKAFDFIILDTPKQHEIHHEDIDEFMKNMKALSKKYNFQIIFSSTEYLFSCDEDDCLWKPIYPGEKHSMFLKSIWLYYFFIKII
ncbi:AAA family ATPase [Providencia rettgeri]|nr:AAA family ATPase [Providencia rettgeri]MDL9987609.1 AAA family ATPase [Providencia rettgeri]